MEKKESIFDIARIVSFDLGMERNPTPEDGLRALARIIAARVIADNRVEEGQDEGELVSSEFSNQKAS